MSNHRPREMIAALQKLRFLKGTEFGLSISWANKTSQVCAKRIREVLSLIRRYTVDGVRCRWTAVAAVQLPRSHVTREFSAESFAVTERDVHAIAGCRRQRFIRDIDAICTVKSLCDTYIWRATRVLQQAARPASCDARSAPYSIVPH